MIKEVLDGERIRLMVAKAILDAPEWTELDHYYFRYRQRLKSEHPDWNWSALNGIPKATRQAILKAGIESGKVPILGGVGGFRWTDLITIGYASCDIVYDDHGEVDYAYCYTGPGYLNVEGTFISPGRWFRDTTRDVLHSNKGGP